MNSMQTMGAARNPFECLALMQHVQGWISDLARQLQAQVQRASHAGKAPSAAAHQHELAEATQKLTQVQALLFSMAPQPAAVGVAVADATQGPGVRLASSVQEFELLLRGCQHSVVRAHALLSDAASHLDRVEAAPR